MIVFPNAKINIGLNVVSCRIDGYHNLETVFYPVKIKDVLEVIEADKIMFTSSGNDIPGNNADNLCLKAYQLLKTDFALPPVHIHLHKNIPIGAGLGGGSADAAFTIKLLNDKFKLELNDTQLESYARQLGADCAFFILNKPVYAFAKGDEFEDVSLDLSKIFIVLVMPKVHISTAEAYHGILPHSSENNLKQDINLALEFWSNRIKNDFEQSIFPNHPILADIKNTLYQAGAVYVSMSGSGSSVYGIFNDSVELSELEKSNQVFYDI